MAISTTSEAQYIKDLTLWTGGGYSGPFSWTGNSGQHADVNFTFDHTLLFSTRPDASSFSPTHEGWALEALKAWSRVADVSFYENDTTYKLVLAFDDIGAGGEFLPESLSGSMLQSGDIVINEDYTNLSPLNFNTVGYSALIHEIGHSLGLDHPKGNGTTTPYTVATSGQSYNASSLIDSQVGALVEPSTPMIFDIATAQFLYGTSDYNNGNSTYSIAGDGTIETTDSSDPNDIIYGNVVTIWDKGGSDTIDASGASGNSLIDLREGFDSYSVDGSGNISLGNQYYSKIGDSLVFFAFNANIEHATGGSGNDNIIGNGLSNSLLGNNGDDTVAGGDGNDTLEGGDGDDVLLGGNGSDLYVYVSGDGLDTIPGDTRSP